MNHSAFYDSDLGKLFSKYESSMNKAVREDCAVEYIDDRNPRKAKEAWIYADKVREELILALEQIA